MRNQATAEMLAADAIDVHLFDTTDQRLMALVKCEGPEFQQDNKRLWDLLSPLVRTTPAWEYVKTCERASDGRRAFRILKLRGEGEAAVDARRTKAEDVLRKAQYTGKSKRFTMQSYINLLQGAFNELEECGDPYTERKKVDTFVRGLVADRFSSIRSQIVGDPARRGDFQLAYGFVETMENFRSTTDGGGDGFDRTISQVATSAGGNPKRNGKGKKQLTKFIPDAEWAKLSSEEKKKIQTARKKKKGNGKGGKGKEKEGGDDLKRKLSEMAAEVLRDIDDKDDDGSSGAAAAKSKAKTKETAGGPHDQFGRHVNAMVRFAQKVATEIDDKSE